MTDDNQNLTVQLAIYSGRPDPQWTLTPDSPYYNAVMERLQHSSTTDLPSILGYKGFLVTMSRKGSHVICEVPRHSDIILENLLLDTAPDDLEGNVTEKARESINDYNTADT